MADTHPALPASSSAELDAVAVAQQWLADRGLPVAAAGGASAVRSTRRRLGGQASESNDPGSSDPRPPDLDSPHVDSTDQETRAREVVLRKLSAQARTRHELDKALRAKDVPAQVANQVLDRMADVGLVDDASFAHDWVNSRQQRRQLSRRALGRELKDRGISQDQIDAALAGVGSEQEYSSALELAWRRRRAMSDDVSREVAYRRLSGVLARRGFEPGLISRVLAEVVDHHSPTAG